MSGFQATKPLDPWTWLGLPLLLCVVGTMLFAIPLRVFGMRLPEPVFALVPAFAWAVIRPSVLPPFLLLLLGLFLDVFHHTPTGLWAVSLLAAYGGVFVTRSMMAGQGRGMMWTWYGAACLVGFGSAYLLTMLDSLSAPNPLATFWQFLATAMLYPFAHRLIQGSEDADVRFR